jgi:hypothetical protein
MKPNFKTVNKDIIMKNVLRTIVLLSFISISFSACFLPQDQGDDFDPPPPPAVVQFIHQNPEMGNIEVLFDGTIVTSISFNSVSSAVTLPQGEGAFAFRQAGAPSSFFETELYTLEARVYTFALVNEQFSDTKVLDLSDVTPEPEENQHWLRFINLSDVEAGRLFRGTEELITLPLDENPSAYIAVESAASTRLALSSENGAPISISEDVQLPSGGASILLISGSAEDDSVIIKPIPLDIERLSLVEPGAEVEEE